MHVFIFLSLSITQAFHSFLSFLSFAPKIHGGGLQFLCLSPPWCLTPPLLWWGSTQPPWIGILARTNFATIVNTPLSYYLWNFGTNDKFSPPPSNPGVENLSTWISDTCWDSVLPGTAAPPLWPPMYRYLYILNPLTESTQVNYNFLPTPLCSIFLKNS